MNRILIGVVTLICVIAVNVFGVEKKPLDYDNLIHWNTISTNIISNDGNFIVYQFGPLVGDSRVVISNVDKSTNDTILYGNGPKLSPESDFVIMKLKQPYDSIRQEKIDKVPEKKRAKDSVQILSLINDIQMVFPKVKNFQVAKKEESLAAILLEKDAFDKEEEKSDSLSTEKKEEIKETGEKEKEVAEKEEGEEEEKKDDKKIEKKPKGDLLVIYDGEEQDTIVCKSVTQYTISDKGGKIAYATEYEDSLLYSSIYIYNQAKEDTLLIFTQQGQVKKLSFDETGEQLSFLFSSDTIKNKTYSLYYTNFESEVVSLVDTLTQQMPEGWSVSENGNIFYSKSGQKLYMGIAPRPEPEKEDTIPADEIPKLDVWSWTDLKLQPQQKLEASKEKKRNYLAMFDFEKKAFIPICDSVYSSFKLTPQKESPYVILYDDKPYLRATNWTARWSADIQVMNLNTGERKLVVKDENDFRISTGGKYTIWYDNRDSSWFCYSNEKGTTVNLTKKLDVNFYDELDDHPLKPGSYGLAGWDTGDRYVLLYDRYDIWKLDPEGEEDAVNLTKGYDREHKTELRLIDMDADDPFTPIKKGFVLKGFNEENNQQYIFSLNKNIKKLVEGPYHFSYIRKSNDSENVILRKEDFQNYPDLYVTDMRFRNLEQVSEVNPQQTEYLWGTVEPHEWISFQGEPLKGLLYKPENFDPEKKYPMVVYFYERNFRTQHRYYTPSPSRSIINKSFYASNGYLVFVPDIVYRDGYPGQSAYDAIISGVTDLTSKYSWIDKDAMALQGQSWGGYQTAYLVTQTDMFAAAMAGAPVSNMTSAYGGIRWGSGLNRMFQYEMTQSRIGGTLWEKTQQYIENSPLFYAPKVNTPLLMMHNDKDGAVPWYQGIEYFVALRRLNKPVWLLTYNNEPHNLNAGSWANRLDLSKRMKQFFDHYLKGEAAPRWLVEGVPAHKKGDELGY